MIKEYTFQGKPAYEGTAKCSVCGNNYHLNTTDKSIFKTGRCFSCFMKNKTASEVKEPIGFVHFENK